MQNYDGIKLFENNNIYIYEYDDGCKIHWKNEELKPNTDEKFPNRTIAYLYYLNYAVKRIFKREV